ncbi:MAG: CdaR family protein [Proteobacteria bacterium]|nr:CdaR family protein [Pseudomonadota bacterium]
MKLKKIKNPFQKLLSVVLAVVIWLFAPSPNKEITEVKFFVPVSYVNLPKNLAIVSDPIQSISVSVEVAKNELAKIHPSMFQVAVDLEEAVSGEKEFEIARNAVSAPNNSRILAIEPKQLSLSFEEVIEKELPIKPVFLGEPAKGYVLEQVTMIPSSVRVRGLVSGLNKLELLTTKAIEIEGIKSDLEMFANILFPERVTAIEPSPENYIVQITVGSEPIVMLFKNIPIGVIKYNYQASINPDTFNMSVRGPRSLLENFKKQDIQAFIDLEGRKPGNYKLDKPEIRLPAEVQIQAIWPPIDIWVKTQRIKR